MARIIVAETGLKLDYKNFMYFVKNGGVWQAPRKGTRGKRKKLVQFGPKDMDYTDYLYYVGRDGNVVATKRKPKGKRKASRKTARKVTRKATRKAARRK